MVVCRCDGDLSNAGRSNFCISIVSCHRSSAVLLTGLCLALYRGKVGALVCEGCGDETELFESLVGTSWKASRVASGGTWPRMVVWGRINPGRVGSASSRLLRMYASCREVPDRGESSERCSCAVNDCEIQLTASVSKGLCSAKSRRLILPFPLDPEMVVWRDCTCGGRGGKPWSKRGARPHESFLKTCVRENEIGQNPWERTMRTNLA